MTKDDVVNKISLRTGIDKITVAQTLDVFTKVVKESLTQKEPVYLRGFGTFAPQLRKQKMGRIITQNKAVVIPAHFKVKFKAGDTFSQKMKAIKL